jgi:hypothetical protein
MYMLIAGGAFHLKMAFTKPAMPSQVTPLGAAATNTQYVRAPHTTTSQAFNSIAPPAVFA